MTGLKDGSRSDAESLGQGAKGQIRSHTAALLILFSALPARSEDVPTQTISFICNSSSIYFTELFPTYKSWKEPFTEGPLSLTIKRFDHGTPLEARFDTALKSRTLFQFQTWFGYLDIGFQLDPDIVISTVVDRRRPISLIIQRDYKNYLFLATTIMQTSEKEADEVNIRVSPNNPALRSRMDQSIISLSGNCLNRAN
jgi:hypothetical protein